MSAQRWFGVFRWRKDGRYRAEDAASRHLREHSAQARADAWNAKQPELGRFGWVVRTFEVVEQEEVR
jgi:hypothetical protein